MVRYSLTLLLGLIVGVANGASNTIGAWTQTAQSDQTVLLMGDYDLSQTFRLWDGATSANGTVLLQDTEKALVVIPDTLSTGVLYCWVVDGANSVTINVPDLFWIEPDDPAIGDSIRLFGRNFGMFSSPTMIVHLEDTTAGTTFTYTATLLSDEIAQLTIAAKDNDGDTISNGEYKIWMDEWKSWGTWNGLDYTGGAFDGSTISIQAAYSWPAGSIAVSEYGATPGDSNSDTEAIQDAIDAASASGTTGTVTLAAGHYDIDQGDGSHAALLTVKSTVRLVGQGPGVTFLDCSWDSASTYASCACLYLNKSNILISSATIRMLGNNFPSSSYPVGTKGDASYPNESENLTLQHLTIDTRGTSLGVPTASWCCWYGLVDDVDIYGSRDFQSVGRQLRFNNVRHHGSRGMHYLTAISPNAYSPQLVSTQACHELIVENCTGRSDLWDSEYGILRRFFMSNDTYGGDNHIVILNCTIETLTSPWAGTGENILNEVGRGHVFRGNGVTIDESTSLVLPTPVDDASVSQFNGHAVAAITAGTGLGQVRDAMQRSTTVYDLDSAFTIEPDSSSSVTIAYVWYENIVTSNTMSGPIYAEGAPAIQMWGHTYGCVFSNNTISNYHVGYIDTALSTASGNVQFTYWNDFRENTIRGGFIGISTHQSEGTKAPDMLLGNTYRENRIESMNLSLPQWELHTTHSAISINDTIWHESEPSSAVVCPIYEDNVISGVERAFTCERFAEFPVLRDNIITSVTRRAYLVRLDNGNWYEDDVSSNSMPEIHLVSVTSGDVARQSFSTYNSNPIYRYLQMDRAIHVVSEDQAGSISTTTSDYDSDSVTITASTGLTVGADGDISWSSLAAGVNELEIYLNDGTETATVPITVYSGGTLEPFNDIWPSAHDSNTSRLVTTVRTYDMDVVANFADTAYSQPSEVDLSLDESTSECKIIVCEREVRLYPTTTTSQAFHNAAMFLTTNLRLQTSGTLILELRESASSMYRATLHPCVSDYNKSYDQYATRLERISGGVVTDRATSLTGHRCEGPILFWANNGNVWLKAWGDIFYMADASPIPIETYSFSIGTSASSNNEYRTCDNVWFSQAISAGGSIPTQTWVNDRAGPDYLSWRVTSDATGVYEELSTLTLTGKLFQLTVIPGTGADQPSDNFALKLLFAGQESVSVTCRNTGTQTFSAEIESLTGFRDLSSAQPQLWISGAGDSNTIEVRLHVI